jgi:hypothetical protein
MFVDIGVYLRNGERAMNRTLVIKDKDGKWYVHPDPSASPLLGDGLNEEKASVEDLTDVYELEGQKHRGFCSPGNVPAPTKSNRSRLAALAPRGEFQFRR